MKKRMNWIAVSLWVAAAVYFVGKLVALPLAASFATSFAGIDTLGAQGKILSVALGHLFDTMSILNDVTGAILGAGQLAALGTVVELLDRIHWQALPTIQPETLPTPS